MLIITVPLQAYGSYKVHLVNSVYWKARLGISAGAFDDDAAYRKAMWAATSRNQIDTVKLLFQEDHASNAHLLADSVFQRNAELVSFYLNNGTEVLPRSLEIVFERILRQKSCDDLQSEDYKLLETLLDKIDKPDNELVKTSVISLCTPLAQKIFDAGGNAHMIGDKSRDLFYYADVPVTSHNSYNGWLHNKPAEEIEGRRAQMKDLILRYQKKQKVSVD